MQKPRSGMCEVPNNALGRMMTYVFNRFTRQWRDAVTTGLSPGLSIFLYDVNDNKYGKS